ncbi:MAG TPA: hypothetical protein VJ438_05585 [Candidatus Nanoarchaeia archaeon]|nr:hypothetical protein [Candidatus Nanoarchaeia archaeon]
MTLEQEFQKALTELRKEKQRKFDQTVDLIINLQKFDVKKTPINLIVNVPHKIKEKKICAFLEAENKKFDTIALEQFRKYEDKKKIKNLVNKYDFFIAQASIMPKVASTFGRVLGPVGKMPSPQLGIIMKSDEKTLNDIKTKIDNSLKIRVKEPSLKIAIGKQSMSDKDIIENIMVVYNSMLKALTRDLENIKNLEIKFTMTKPKKISVR